MNARVRTLRWWAAMVCLLIVAFALRVWNLPTAPPGITHDEASNGHDSAAILEGEHRIYFPVGYGHEPLYNYSVAAATIFLGQSIFTLRMTTVAWSLLQVIATVALARRWWGRSGALGVATAYAASFWALMMARVGLRAPALPALLALSVLSYDHAIHPRRRRLTRVAPLVPTRVPLSTVGGTIAAGIFLGAGVYTYMASRGMPLLYLAFLAALAIVDRSRLRAVWQGTLVVVLIAGLIGAPLFLYLARHPELEQRIGQLGSAITALRHGEWRPLARNIIDSLPMLLVRGDPQWLYNIAGRPGLEPFLATFFVLGLIRALRYWRDERALITLIWLAGGVTPALLVSVAYNLLHAIAAMPAVMLLIGAGFSWLSSVNRRPGRRYRTLWRALVVTCVIGFAATTATTAHAYFTTWSGNRNVRVAYHHHVVRLGRYLERAPQDGPVVITTLYPGEFHDPYTMEVTLGRQDPDLRWADGRRALFVPADPARLFIEEQTQPSAPVWHWLQPDLSPITTLNFGADDIPSKTEGYIWDTDTTWQRILTAAGTTVLAAPGDPAPTHDHVTVALPAAFGETVALMGYRWVGDPDGAGASLSLLTAWQVLGSTPLELTSFAHLLGPTGDLVTQDDRLDAPSWQWQAGDRWLQLYQLAVPGDLPHGEYRVAVGLYDRASLDRLPVHTDPPVPAPGATRILIPLEVAGP